jgi:glycine cleavage system protein P-like pyridoxal-binding family
MLQAASYLRFPDVLAILEKNVHKICLMPFEKHFQLYIDTTNVRFR